MGAKCDRCGNFDEGYREEMEYPKDAQHCIQDYQPDCITTGIPRWRRFTIGGTVSHTLIVCAKSVLILPTLAKKLFGATINGNERS